MPPAAADVIFFAATDRLLMLPPHSLAYATILRFIIGHRFSNLIIIITPLMAYTPFLFAAAYFASAVVIITLPYAD